MENKLELDVDIQKMIDEAVKKQVDKLKVSMVPHNCFTCGWFIMRTEKPRNRACRYPTALKTKGNRCLCWKLELDVEKRGMGIC